jgi:hypothetical protein
VFPVDPEVVPDSLGFLTTEMTQAAHVWDLRR